MPPIYLQEGDLHIRLFLQPKASKDQFVGIHNDELKITITAPPIDGKANEHLIKFLSKSFRVPKSAVILEKGELSRHKYVRIQAPKQIPEIIQRLLSDFNQKMSEN
ncbi:YggU family protein [Actinobacillus delphinicola]|uniref:UPF0235 protein NCTC12871_00436 n=1 Tax=Actinobacillus delphinicola TaxID=51161 RepID=A0A448TSK1_9PAST|nr:DUF167 family protein YggU [Actinobacillus delphinicola]MDG6897187.1 YggU family protein [Actinobacillus delphinicola]VEJ09007.1 Uncharacterised ACR, YggU family COG1872 [Actinobacillus delphinicola]